MIVSVIQMAMHMLCVDNLRSLRCFVRSMRLIIVYYAITHRVGSIKR